MNRFLMLLLATAIFSQKILALLTPSTYYPKQNARRLSVEAIKIDQQEPELRNLPILLNTNNVHSNDKQLNASTNNRYRRRDLERNLRQTPFVINSRMRNDLDKAFDTRFADFNFKRFSLDKNLIENDNLLENNDDERFFR